MKKIYIYGATALGLLFTACSSDDLPIEPELNRTNVDRTLYVNMSICGDALSGSRAAGDNGTPAETGDFDDGTNESEVSKAYFVFYDAAGNLVGEVVPVTLPTAITTSNSGTVEKRYEQTVAVSVFKGEQNPAQVICYINPITPSSLQNPLDVIQTNTRDILYTGTATKYFAMSNSVYYPGEGPSNIPSNTAVPQIAVPINANQLFTTKDAAQKALDAYQNPEAGKTPDASALVDIYVERYAAKLAFQTEKKPEPYVTATSAINDEAETKVTLTFEVNKWALNAACQESYIVKSFRQESSEGSILADNYTYGALNSRINAESFALGEGGNITYSGVLNTGAWSWNNPVFHRSYWAMSPAYFTNTYPEVSSDVTEDLANAIKQKYYSYNEVTATGSTVGFSTTSGAQYFHETTVGAKALTSKNPAAATPSVILVGDYKVKVDDGADLPNTTFYTYLTGSNGKPLVFFEAAAGDVEGKSAVTGGESMLRRFIEQTSILFKKEGNDYVAYSSTNVDDIKTLVNLLAVEAPSPEVRGSMKIAERYRTLQFATDVNATQLSNIYVATTDGYMGIGEGEGKITKDEANKALMQQVGFCNKYVAGAGYFNIPVKHYGWYRTGNDQKNEDKIDWSKVRVGDFGVVRNHSYSINVSKIEGLATGIGGKDSPIVPPADTKDFYIAYRVNILKWAVVPTQTVAL